MGEVQKIVRDLKALASELGFNADWQEDSGQLNLWSRSQWFSLNVAVQGSALFSYINVRGPRGVSGNITPTIELLSIYLGLSLYHMGYCSACIWDVEHPCIDGELKAQLISLEQISQSPAPSTGIDGVKDLLMHLSALEQLFPALIGCSKSCCDNGGENIDASEFSSWEKQLAAITAEWDDEKYFEYNRCLPVRSCAIGEDLRIMYCPRLFETMGHGALEQIIRIDGISGQLYLHKEIRNFISYFDNEDVLRLLHKINGSKTQVAIYPLNNAIVGISGSYLVKKRVYAGIKEFNRERDVIRPRHQLEAQHLFGGKIYTWSENIDDERFEFLCEDLIKLESGVEWARKVGAGNAPDGGKDIIFTKQRSRINPSGERLDFVEEKWIAQCKAYKGSVGKSTVSDIRDTVDGHNAVGYLLIVATCITPPLLDHLCRLRDAGKIQAEWWTRSELEDRLERNPHLLKKYSDLVSVNFD